ncbi:hypothetical protein KCP70_23310 [Salmonella enterica subsp. enterica]|nr:hypothetical protein KCP70_23310 [Salmonella enterica subsp. enterica]
MPHTHNFESWGFTAPWGGVAAKPLPPAGRFPPLTERRTGNLSQWKHLYCGSKSYPAFGDRAITDPQGNTFPLNRAGRLTSARAANIAL